MTHRNQTMTAPKPESPACSGNSMEETYLLAMRCPVYRRRDCNPGFRAELENLAGDGKGKGTSGSTVRPKAPMRQLRGGLLFVGDETGVMPVERREQVICVEIELGQLETGGTRRFRRKAAAFIGWHEPDKSRGLRPVL